MAKIETTKIILELLHEEMKFAQKVYELEFRQIGEEAKEVKEEIVKANISCRKPYEIELEIDKLMKEAMEFDEIHKQLEVGLITFEEYVNKLIYEFMKLKGE